MSLIMQPARIPAGGAFPILGLLYPTSGQTFIRGAILVPEAGNTGNYVEAGANPALISGVALQGVDTAPGFAMANNPTTITGRQYKVSVATPAQTVFEAAITNGSSTRVDPAATDIGQEYGVTAYSGVWTVDRNKTGGLARVKVVGVDTDAPAGKGIVFFTFLPANI